MQNEQRTAETMTTLGNEKFNIASIIRHLQSVVTVCCDYDNRQRAALAVRLIAAQHEAIKRLTAERDAARREAETFRHDTSVALAALDDAKKLAVRQASEIRRLAGPREPPHCCSCSCGMANS